MNEANRERLEMLLKGHEQMLEEKRLRPEGVLRQNDELREQFNRVARSVIVPVLEEIKDVMVGKVESASISAARRCAAPITAIRILVVAAMLGDRWASPYTWSSWPVTRSAGSLKSSIWSSITRFSDGLVRWPWS